MFDTMTVTKVGGALCGALLVFLLIKWGAEIVYSTEAGHGDHAEAAYVIEVEGADDHGSGEAEAVDMVALVAAADAAKGERVFGKCKACHKIGAGENGTGPTLFNILDRDIASIGGFNFSGALSGLEGTWSIQHLSDFLTNPKAYAPGTKMGFAGLKSDDDRANLIAYLATLK